MRPKKVVLIVSADDSSRSVLTFMLETNGYRVFPAENATCALSLFTDHRVDIVLTDLDLPEMNGDQLIRQLKKKAAGIPMVLMSHPAETEGMIHAADAFIWKEKCSAMELLECVKQKSARKRGPRKGICLVQPVLAPA